MGTQHDGDRVSRHFDRARQHRVQHRATVDAHQLLWRTETSGRPGCEDQRMQRAIPATRRSIIAQLPREPTESAAAADCRGPAAAARRGRAQRGRCRRAAVRRRRRSARRSSRIESASTARGGAPVGDGVVGLEQGLQRMSPAGEHVRIERKIAAQRGDERGIVTRSPAASRPPARRQRLERLAAGGERLSEVLERRAVACASAGTRARNRSQCAWSWALKRPTMNTR